MSRSPSYVHDESKRDKSNARPLLTTLTAFKKCNLPEMRENAYCAFFNIRVVFCINVFPLPFKNCCSLHAVITALGHLFIYYYFF